MAKRNRENALRERRLRKQARKEARKLAAAEGRAEEATGDASPVGENGSDPLAVPEEDANPEASAPPAAAPRDGA